jgi:hypothetical protein
MIGLFFAAMLLSTQEGIPGVDIYDGRCDYPAKLGPKKPNETRVDCDLAIVSPGREPNSIMVQFAQKTGGDPVGFVGDVDDSGTLTIRRIYLKPGVPTPAKGGHCRIFHHGDALSGISCIGFIGERVIVANFRALDPRFR